MVGPNFFSFISFFILSNNTEFAINGKFSNNRRIQMAKRPGTSTITKMQRLVGEKRKKRERRREREREREGEREKVQSQELMNT